MRVAFITILFFLFKSLTAQDIYPLHPSVGDTIDRNEKLDYSLFAKSANNGFNFAIITYVNEGFVLIENRSRKQPNTLIREYTDTTELTQNQIIEEQRKIQRVNSYYQYLAAEAKKPKVEEPKKVDNKIPVRFESSVSKKMLKEDRMRLRLLEDQRRVQDFEMGLRPREVTIQIR